MKVVRVTTLAERGFVPTELALVLDVLRIATRLGTEVEFVHQVCTTQEDPLVEGMGGCQVRAIPFETDCHARPDHLVVLGGQGIASVFSDLKGRLSKLERSGVDIALLSDAAAEWKRLNPEKDHITTHWEIQQLDQDVHSITEPQLPLFTEQARIATGGGMASTADFILTRIVAPHSLHLAQSVAQTLLSGEIRDGSDRQPRSENDVLSLRQMKLASVISAMEGALETPLSMDELAAVAGVSVRQIERRFRTLLGQSPAGYYRSLRLRRARTLVEQSPLPISEIAVACGFGSLSNFSKKYAQEFGISPSKRRLQLSTASRRYSTSPVKQGPNHAPFPLPSGSLCASRYTVGTYETLVQRTRR